MDEIGFRRTGTREEDAPAAIPEVKSKQPRPVEDAITSIETFLTYGIVVTAVIIGEQVALLRNTRAVRTH